MPDIVTGTVILLETCPIISDADFKTPVTSITSASAGLSVTLYQLAGGTLTSTAITPSATDDVVHNYWTHTAKGVYTLRVTVAQNNVSACTMWIEGNVTGGLPFWSTKHRVGTANVVGALNGTDCLDVAVVETITVPANLTQMQGTAIFEATPTWNALNFSELFGSINPSAVNFGLDYDPAEKADLTAAVSAVESYGDLKWLTATGFATPTNVTDAVTAIENYGDANWIVSLSGIATATNVADAVTAIEDYGDIHWVTATGFATPTNVSDAVTAIEGYGDANWIVSLSGIATATNVTDAVTAIEDYGDSKWITATGFATLENLTDAVTAIEYYGGTGPWTTASGFSTSTDITTAVTNIEDYGDAHWVPGDITGNLTTEED